MDFQGFAIGGLSVGEPKSMMLAILGGTLPLLPEKAPRYLMGVGTPEDILDAVMLGVDFFRLRSSDTECPKWNALHLAREDVDQTGPVCRRQEPD